MQVTVKPGYDDAQTVRTLFDEYTQLLVEGDPVFARYLAMQNYAAELEDLREKYGMPHGRLYVAYVDGAAAGCVALRRVDAATCELKRLYVRDAYRGQRIGRLLVEKIISEAKAAGYRRMILDTLPFLQAAIGLYRACGFCETEKFNDSPMEGALYMQLDLNAVRA